MREMKLQDLKSKTPPELLAFAEEQEIENASTMRKQELMFAILKQLATKEVDIIGEGVLEVLPDGFGFLRSPESNYLPCPDDIYVSPSQIRRFGLRTGTRRWPNPHPKDGSATSRCSRSTRSTEDPDKANHKINFENLTPLFPKQRLIMEHEARSRRTFDPRHRLGRAYRQRPARLDRFAATHGQDRAAAEHREFDHANDPECYLIVLLIDERPKKSPTCSAR